MYIDRIPENKEVLYSTDYSLKGEQLYLYFAKMKGDKYNYFFKCYVNQNGVRKCIGYIYFTISRDLHNSCFIGTYVSPEYRGWGVASFLVSQWINFCFNESLYFLGANKKQRKPFLLYLLKTFGFEILDPSYYDRCDETISICKRADSSKKLLLFKSPSEEAKFMKSPIAKSDNYDTVSPNEDYIILDRVLPVRKYNIEDSGKASNKCNLVLQRCKK